MKPTTQYLLKIWGLSIISSILFRFGTDLLRYGEIRYLLRTLFVGGLVSVLFIVPFLKFGGAILSNHQSTPTINYKKELTKLACFLSFNIWIFNFFYFTLFGNLDKNHFYVIPFLFTMILSIRYFKIERVNIEYDDSILDENLDLEND